MRILIILCLFVAGCGYHVPGASDTWVGGEARTLYVSLFDNQTSDPYVENYITDALVAELSRSRVIRITEDKASADLSLDGSVDSFDSEALSFDSSDRIADYRATMVVSLRMLSRVEQRTVWKEKFRRSEDYPGIVDKNWQLEGRRQASQVIAERLAEDIHARLLNNF